MRCLSVPTGSRFKKLLPLVLLCFFSGTFSGISIANAVENTRSAVPLNNNKPAWFGANTTIQPVAFSLTDFRKITAKQKVLFVYSKASSAYDQAFITITQAFRRYQQDVGYLVVNFRQQPELVRQLMQQPEFNLAFVAGSKATSALYTSQLKPAMPVVSVTAKDPVLMGLRESYDAPSGLTGSRALPPEKQRYAFTSLNIRAESLVSYLQTLNPNLVSIGIVYGSSNQSALKTQVQPLVQAARASGIHVNVISIDASDPEASLQQEIPAALANSRKVDPELKQTLLWLTGSTLLFSRLEQIDALASRVPVLSAVPDLVSSQPGSPMLSIGISFESNAALAALYGRQILTGRHTPGQLPVGELSPPDIAINFKKVAESGWTIPLRMFELATILYNSNGQPVNRGGMQLEQGEN
ncbi:ABC transporter substrate-binding protein [Endozoicomonadaceae bacterium StTr2]